MTAPSALPMRIASFDVGLRNLSVCVADADAAGALAVRRWEIVDVLGERHASGKTAPIEACVRCMVDALAAQDWAGVDRVAIEQQPVGRAACSNARMKVVSHVMQAWFYARGVAVEFVSPKRKNEGMALVKAGKAKERYRERKDAAVAETRRLIAGTEWAAWFERLPKADDAADSFLQARWVALREAEKAANAAAKAAAKAEKAAAKAREKAEKAAARAAAKAEKAAARAAEKAAKAAAKKEAKKAEGIAPPPPPKRARRA